MIWVIITISLYSVLTICQAIYAYRARKLYYQLKRDREVYEQRIKNFILEMIVLSPDKSIERDMLIDYAEKLYHEISGDFILKKVK